MDSFDFEPLSALIDDESAPEEETESVPLPLAEDDAGTSDADDLSQGKQSNVAPCQNVRSKNKKRLFFVTFEDSALEAYIESCGHGVSKFFSPRGTTDIVILNKSKSVAILNVDMPLSRARRAVLLGKSKRVGLPTSLDNIMHIATEKEMGIHTKTEVLLKLGSYEHENHHGSDLHVKQEKKAITVRKLKATIY